MSKMPAKSIPSTAEFPLRSLLVRGVNWIGDALMTVPALRELRLRQPQLRITLMARPWVLGLFEGQDFMDAALEASSSGSWPMREKADREAMRRENYDAVLILPNAIGPAWVARRAGIEQRWGYAADARRLLLTRAVSKGRHLRGRHQCYHYLHLLYALGLSPIDYLQEPDFRPSSALLRSATQQEQACTTAERFGFLPRSSRPLVGIHAGASYGTAKRWFAERFAQTANSLIERFQAQVFLIGSQTEQALAEEIARLSPHSPRVLAGKTSLRELTELMSLCDLFLANDSGPMHLAAALDVPLIALFGSTDPTATAPLGSQVWIVKKETACSPCLLRECPQDLRCFDRISANEVISLAEKALQERGFSRK